MRVAAGDGSPLSGTRGSLSDVTDVVLFHHVQGLTPGVTAFADALRAAGHRVTVPDLLDGAVFRTVEEGLAHVESIGTQVLAEQAAAAVAALPERLVYAGFSLGVMRAQELAQTRPGALGALLLHSAVPAAAFGSGWPRNVDLQVHVHDEDPLGDVDDARELVAGVPGAELFLYPGSTHLFTDNSLPDHHPQHTALVLERALAFLARLG